MAITWGVVLCFDLIQSSKHVLNTCDMQSTLLDTGGYRRRKTLAILEDGNGVFEVEAGKEENNSTSQQTSSQEARLTLTRKSPIVVLVAKIEA